ncbi:hypothetical protein C2G38_2105847 [Gigaspora rosea]|uniref:Uncharacterized protein n=1 Tax=Gigaspora rosea TaxID=44941 RepID=A0A397TXK2_9GLOM|nr:hypothetical protein C2G38_2125890 [Gigaspora rosea]RIB10525.1 hypothetical protein C2G38_2105847 [Gigaspora rosea]
MIVFNKFYSKRNIKHGKCRNCDRYKHIIRLVPNTWSIDKRKYKLNDVLKNMKA